MAGETKKIIQRLELDNGMELVLYDCSRVMTGDLWLVDLCCEAYFPVTENYWEIAADEDSHLLPAIREMLGERLVYVVNKKRNFIDIRERETVLQEMAQQFQDSILEYLKKPAFPLSLFRKQYQDARQKVLIQRAINQAAQARSEE